MTPPFWIGRRYPKGYETRPTQTAPYLLSQIYAQVSSRSAKSTAPRSSVECKVQWLGCDHPQINNCAWTSQELEELVEAVQELRTVAPVDEAAEAKDEDEDDERPDVQVDWSEVSQRLEVRLFRGRNCGIKLH